MVNAEEQENRGNEQGLLHTSDYFKLASLLFPKPSQMLNIRDSGSTLQVHMKRNTTYRNTINCSHQCTTLIPLRICKEAASTESVISIEFEDSAYS